MDQSAAWVYVLIRVLSCGIWVFAGLLALMLLDPAKPAWLRALVTG